MVSKTSKLFGALERVSPGGSTQVNDEASRSGSSTIFGVNRTVIDSSATPQGPFRFDFT